MSISPVAAASADHPDNLSPQHVHRLANGLTLVAEEVPHVRSAAVCMLVPAGCASDPPHATGAANVLSEWILRGAGERDSRQLTDYLDSLGVQRGTSAEVMYFRLTAGVLSRNLAATLPVYADLVQRPHLPDDGFGPALDLTLQQLEAVEDEPSQKLSLVLRERQYDYPWGRPALGVREELERLTAKALRRDCQTRFGPDQTILAVAGAFDYQALRAQVEELFGDWSARPRPKVRTRPAPRGALDIPQDTNQTQIGLAFSTVAERSEQAILVNYAATVLSGGMGGRLFNEVREKLGLCYSIAVDYHSLLHTGALFGYSASAPERAQQTLDAFVTELRRLRQGVAADEFERARVGMKSRAIMQAESTAARAGALAYDYVHLGRLRTLAQVRQSIEDVTLPAFNAFLSELPIDPLTLVTIGPKALTLP